MLNKIKILLTSFFLSLTYFSFSQTNLVPNPSFEDTVSCPFSFGLEAYVQNWKSARETPDYFNSCSTWSGASTPSNDYGYQLAYFGNAYVGLLTYRSDSSVYTEAIGVQLSQALQTGVRYYVSFQVSLTLENTTGSMAANNKIGVQFSNTEHSVTNPIPVNNFAHIYTNSIITDTTSWTTVSGSFVADSAYSYLNLGNFFDKPYIDTMIYGATFGAYYYFDNVCVSSDSLTCSQTSVNVNQIQNNLPSFNLYPNPVTNVLHIKCPFIPSEIELFDLVGKSQLKFDNFNSPIYIIDASFLNNGFYLLKIKAQDQIIQKQIIISK